MGNPETREQTIVHEQTGFLDEFNEGDPAKLEARRQEIVSELNAHRLDWLGLRSRNERAHGHDGRLAREYQASSEQIDSLLDKLSATRFVSGLIAESHM